MKGAFKICLILIIALVIALAGGYYIYKSALNKPSHAAGISYEWRTIDESYSPKDLVEEFIKNDADARDIFPVSIINYGNEKSFLSRFRGSRFAGPSDAQLKMMFNGMEDWKLIDIKYQNKKEREIKRTVLYVYRNGEWSVGDSGQLAQ